MKMKQLVKIYRIFLATFLAGGILISANDYAMASVITGNDYWVNCSNTKDSQIQKSYCLGIINGMKAGFAFDWVTGIYTNQSVGLLSSSDAKQCEKALLTTLDSTLNAAPNIKLNQLVLADLKNNPLEKRNPIMGVFNDVIFKIFPGKFSVYPFACTPNLTYKEREKMLKFAEQNSK